jgi:hypothetical protein
MDNHGTLVLDQLDVLAEAAARDGLSGSERLARLTVFRDAVTDIAAARALDPYRGGRHSIIVDTLRAERSHRDRTVDDGGAIDRLHRHQLAGLLERAVSNQVTGDTPGLLPQGVPADLAGTPIPSAVTPLLALATRYDLRGPTVDLPQLGAWPPAVIDPIEKSQLNTAKMPVDVAPTPVRVSAYGLNVAQQVIHWTVDGMAQLESLMGAVVDRGLEGALVADFAAAAGAPVAGLDAAEAAVATATGLAPDLIVVNPVDVPKVRTHYAPSPIPMRLVAVAGLTAGVALVAAMPAVWLLTGDRQWMSADEPSLMGRAVAVFRYGAAAPWLTGAIAAATLA